ncbi:hypothetical protein METBIDRAFT_222998 [Metschnikowia bicuspidata var. bicuspidata NRRL YB-4993]|uniref:F-box domain-containing protein n=1 Tax=Metschnikowia bicuspidata var. bicuspidata NRRL YB-4993 TaxID=869754 RepID=A0A1A0H622_9ASCO|nr:hypothetical protein METBIDRAFT_222998 [Metschnikowia bicuspidata var. bicuspidata NRRL YB-4993]OBA19405.1 hypothetical protein METBIDRAFT_222998 [Metschnikowia bicuspidata var. bicuspidata NRRL YB-4993]
MEFALPLDVLRDIGRWLPQNELLHLAFTCKRVYKALHAEIYRAVVLDSSKRVFGDDWPAGRRVCSADEPDAVFEPVVIRSLFALTHFLKTLQAHPDYARLVSVLIARPQIPDMPELALHGLLQTVFPLLSSIRVLHWYLRSGPLQAQLLTLLPHPHHLQSLRGNFGRPTPAMFRSEYSTLRHVELSDFGPARSLQAIDFETLPRISSLTLSKTSSSNQLLFSSLLDACCQNALGPKAISMGPYINEGNTPTYVSALFSPPPTTPLLLRSLVLRGMCLKASDARLLLESIDCSSLRHLSLENCFETLFEDLPDNGPPANRIQIRRRRAPDVSFMDLLSEGLQKLQLLKISLSNEMCYNSATFRAISKMNGLSQLSVHLKTFCRNGPVDFTHLVDSLQSHKDTLRYLDICSNVVDEITAPPCPKNRNYYKLESILGLSHLRQLRFLRIPTTYSQIEKVPVVLSELENLKVVQLLVTDLERTAPNPCNGCPNTTKSALCNFNSLIAQEFFTCANPFVNNLEHEQNMQHLQYATEYRNILSTLSYLRFDLKQVSQVFDCNSLNHIRLKGQMYVDNFDALIQLSIDV